MPSVLLVEDDIDIAESLGDYLETHQYTVDFAYSATQARARLQHGTFDVIILDINLPDKNGLALCAELTQAQALATPIVFLTARGNLHDKLAGFSAGAMDYIVKPFAPEELLARLHVITEQRKGASGYSLNAGDFRLNVQSGLLQWQNKSLQLHATALTIVQCLMQGSPHTVQRQTLITALWGSDVPVSDPLRAHIYEIRKHMLGAFGYCPIKTVKGIGYVFGGL